MLWAQYPSTVVAGDLILFYATMTTSGISYSTLAVSDAAGRSWNRLSGNIGYNSNQSVTVVFWRVADGNESNDYIYINQPYKQGTYRASGAIVLAIQDASCWAGCSESDVFGDKSAGYSASYSYTRPFQSLNVTEKNGLTLGITACGTSTVSSWSSPSLGNWGDISGGYTWVSRLAQISNHFGNTGGGSWNSNAYSNSAFQSVLIRGAQKARRIFVT